ncbi:hypothetical protein GUI12_03410 [Anaplasmataceae bacterium AB001_6]|nr:hypothetical protein GUI12_03410 [Anaplasmataceae bacterium AB001_6]
MSNGVDMIDDDKIVGGIAKEIMSLNIGQFIKLIELLKVEFKMDTLFPMPSNVPMSVAADAGNKSGDAEVKSEELPDKMDIVFKSLKDQASIAPAMRVMKDFLSKAKSSDSASMTLIEIKKLLSSMPSNPFVNIDRKLLDDYKAKFDEVGIEISVTPSS